MSSDLRRATDGRLRSWLFRSLGFPHAEREGYLKQAAVASLLIAGVIAGVIAFAAWTQTKPLPSESDSAARESSPNQPLTHSPLLEWNATQTELDATANAIETLEADAKSDLE